MVSQLVSYLFTECKLFENEVLNYSILKNQMPQSCFLFMVGFFVLVCLKSSSTPCCLDKYSSAVYFG